MRAHVAVGTGLDMAPRAAVRHCMMARAAFRTCGGQGMSLLIGRKGILEDRLQRDERHRCLRTRGRGRIIGMFCTVSRQLSPLQAVSPTLALTCCWKRERGTSGRCKQSGAVLG